MPSKTVFLSYNGKDSKFAGRLSKRLREYDIEVWHDVEHSEDDWQDAEIEAIRRCDCFLALFGPNGVGKEQKLEIRYALLLKKQDKIRFIPVLITGYDAAKARDFNDFLDSNFKHQDLRGGVRKSEVRALASTIR